MKGLWSYWYLQKSPSRCGKACPILKSSTEMYANLSRMSTKCSHLRRNQEVLTIYWGRLYSTSCVSVSFLFQLILICILVFESQL